LTRASELGVVQWLLPILWCAFWRGQERRKHARRPSGRPRRSPSDDPGGWLFYAGIYLGFGWATAAWHVWVLFLAYAVFYALTEPAEKTLVANLVGPERRGLAYGWYNCAIGIATLPASVLFGALYQAFGAPVAFGSGAGLALAAAILLAWL